MSVHSYMNKLGVPFVGMKMAAPSALPNCSEYSMKGHEGYKPSTWIV